jgi:hypothetical protein
MERPVAVWNDPLLYGTTRCCMERPVAVWNDERGLTNVIFTDNMLLRGTYE